jgi:hypothetical protein
VLDRILINFRRYLILLTIFKRTWIGIALIAASAATLAQPTAPARAIAFKPGTLADAQVAAFCAKLATPCNAPTTRAWIANASALGTTFLIDSSRPMLVAVRDGSAGQSWDFAGYAHSQPTRDTGAGDTREPLELFPALYPAVNAQYAVALVRNLRESYSGGGAGFAYADFVVLRADGKYAPTPLYAGVPFSCSKMIRACFSERDYKTSRHCHDEMNGYLTIQFPARAGDVPGESGWTFFWHQSDWPANVTKSHARRTQTRFVLPANNMKSMNGANASLPPNVSFCGAPQ